MVHLQRNFVLIFFGFLFVDFVFFHITTHTLQILNIVAIALSDEKHFVKKIYGGKVECLIQIKRKYILKY